MTKPPSPLDQPDDGATIMDERLRSTVERLVHGGVPSASDTAVDSAVVALDESTEEVLLPAHDATSVQRSAAHTVPVTAKHAIASDLSRAPHAPIPSPPPPSHTLSRAASPPPPPPPPPPAPSIALAAVPIAAESSTWQAPASQGARAADAVAVVDVAAAQAATAPARSSWLPFVVLCAASAASFAAAALLFMYLGALERAGGGKVHWLIAVIYNAFGKWACIGIPAVVGAATAAVAFTMLIRRARAL